MNLFGKTCFSNKMLLIVLNVNADWEIEINTFFRFESLFLSQYTHIWGCMYSFKNTYYTHTYRFIILYSLLAKWMNITFTSLRARSSIMLYMIEVCIYRCVYMSSFLFSGTRPWVIHTCFLWLCNFLYLDISYSLAFVLCLAYLVFRLLCDLLIKVVSNF